MSRYFERQMQAELAYGLGHSSLYRPEQQRPTSKDLTALSKPNTSGRLLVTNHLSPTSKT